MDPVISRPETIIVQPASYIERLNVEALFATRQPLEIELGAGDGSFLAQWAALNPGQNFLGVERLLGRLKKIDRKARRAGLTNVRVLRLEASYFTEYLLPHQSVAAVHIYFPDPWPKRKHRQNRLINKRFAEVLRAPLIPGGIIYLRTDDTVYFAQMQFVFSANRNFEEVPVPLRLAEVLTDFERVFVARKIQTHRTAYRRMA